MSKQAFQHIKYWIFDLDNTLYPPEINLFTKIDIKITGFIQEYLNLSKDDALQIQKHYWKKYGSTLAGLMHEHKLSPDSFLDFVHDVDVSQLLPNPELDTILTELQGDKYIFTNGTKQHAERVSHQLGILHHFKKIFDVRAADYIPKPQKATYEKMLAYCDINPLEAVFFEDLACNLLPAAQLGIKTVWISPPAETTISTDPNMSPRQEELQHLDYITPALIPFLKSLL